MISPVPELLTDTQEPAVPENRCVTVLLFEGFDLLDVFGPVEFFQATGGIQVELCSPSGPGLVRSSHGVQVRAEISWEESRNDVLLVPGGAGTRPLAADKDFLASLARIASDRPLVSSVCTGSALLAAAGLLEGYRATSNKRAFSWASSFGSDVEWLPRARWVQDRDRWTSSGVAAGLDMAAAMVADWHGLASSRAVAHRIELDVRENSEDDPFAADPRR